MHERDAVQIDDVLRELSSDDPHLQKNAWHTLVEAGTSALPQVIAAYHNAPDRQTRLVLLSIVSQYRTLEALDFWAGVLASKDDEFWKAALDGLVSLGGESSRRVLSDGMTATKSIKNEWIEEAIAQICERRDEER